MIRKKKLKRIVYSVLIEDDQDNPVNSGNFAEELMDHLERLDVSQKIVEIRHLDNRTLNTGLLRNS